MHLETKHFLTTLSATIITASFLEKLSLMLADEAVFLLFILGSLTITFVKYSSDTSKCVTPKKVIWTLSVTLVLCSLLRIYQEENNLGRFWFYFATVCIGVFAPSAIYRILQKSDEKAETAFAKIVSAFVDGIVYRIDAFFGKPAKDNCQIQAEDKEETTTDTENLNNDENQ